MKLNNLFRFLLFCAVISVSFILVSCQNDKGILDPNTPSSGSAALNKSSNAIVQRDISDFLSGQTAWWYWFDTNDFTKYLSVDYAGLQNNYYHLNITSSYSGSITEKALSDGTAEVHIVLHAHLAFDGYAVEYVNLQPVSNSH